MQIAPISLTAPVQGFSATITGTIETIEQGIALLMQIGNEDYQKAAPPLVTSSMGEHCRHVLDIFHALSDFENGVDYNQRRRGHDVEKTRELAIVEFLSIKQWLSQLTPDEIKQTVTVKTEVALSETLSAEVSAQLEREIAFAAAHATHHYALMKVLAIQLGYQTDKELGFAPATSSYLREKS
ncbi:hypothetical protein VINI7043_14635 [Vibrio nigripulchritudo ATCC 27043]|uniref:hypothetical protein n=1 Tax=Vibrio nigripulchritudo TaxID=28173 RepID=UPI00021C3756|nr:hypothetical protein [Vibrio nigripulchritudo]EGU61450.1 hypothetical protein VINI7043_14635 [Vibrio nigripulchritudo ATCC 27043]